MHAPSPSQPSTSFQDRWAPQAPEPWASSPGGWSAWQPHPRGTLVALGPAPLLWKERQLPLASATWRSSGPAEL